MLLTVLRIIAGLVREAKVNEVYHAKVVRIEKFGAFVNLFDKTDALVHISEMAWTRTNNVEVFSSNWLIL